MIEKPDVLSDDKIDEAWPSETEAKLPRTASELPQFVEEIRRCARIVAQAQRDADVAYYEPIINKFEEIQQAQEALGAKLNDVELAIQQAKAEVAREIFEIAKREVKYALRQELFKIPSYKQQDAVAHNLGSRLEAALKDKYLKGAA